MKYAKNNIESLELTQQTESVLCVMRESDKHLIAKEIFGDACRLLPGISFAGDYNNLQNLNNEGLISEISFGTGVKLYTRKLRRHDHAICNSCEKLVNLELFLPEERLKEQQTTRNSNLFKSN